MDQQTLTLQDLEEKLKTSDDSTPHVCPTLEVTKEVGQKYIELSTELLKGTWEDGNEWIEAADTSFKIKQLIENIITGVETKNNWLRNTNLSELHQITNELQPPQNAYYRALKT